MPSAPGGGGRRHGVGLRRGGPGGRRRRRQARPAEAVIAGQAGAVGADGGALASAAGAACASASTGVVISAAPASAAAQVEKQSCARIVGRHPRLPAASEHAERQSAGQRRAPARGSARSSAPMVFGARMACGVCACVHDQRRRHGLQAPAGADALDLPHRALAIAAGADHRRVGAAPGCAPAPGSNGGRSPHQAGHRRQVFRRHEQVGVRPAIRSSGPRELETGAAPPHCRRALSATASAIYGCRRSAVPDDEQRLHGGCVIAAGCGPAAGSSRSSAGCRWSARPPAAPGRPVAQLLFFLGVGG